MLLSLTCMAGRTSRVPLAICNPKLLVLYIAHMFILYSIHAYNTHMRAMTDLYCSVELVSVIKASRSVVFVYYRG